MISLSTAPVAPSSSCSLPIAKFFHIAETPLFADEGEGTSRIGCRNCGSESLQSYRRISAFPTHVIMLIELSTGTIGLGRPQPTRPASRRRKVVVGKWSGEWARLAAPDRRSPPPISSHHCLLYASSRHCTAYLLLVSGGIHLAEEVGVSSS